MKGFILEALTRRGVKAINYYFKNLPYKKDKLGDDPLKIMFSFTKEKEKLIKNSDLWFIEKQLKISHNIEKDKDYTLRSVE